jgi:hypothetical protein
MRQDWRRLIYSTNLSTRLHDLENAVLQSNSRAEVCAYVQGLMREIVAPLETINNLNYLALQDPTEYSKIAYLTMAQEQLAVLNAIALSALRFCDGIQDQPL